MLQKKLKTCHVTLKFTFLSHVTFGDILQIPSPHNCQVLLERSILIVTMVAQIFWQKSSFHLLSLKCLKLSFFSQIYLA